MMEEFAKQGCGALQIRAKLFGGGHMFSAIPHDSPFNIGVKNVEQAKEIMAQKGLRLTGEDTGGNYGRTIEFDLAVGKVTIKTIFHGDKEL
jgi:chemotaxis protein CheD